MRRTKIIATLGPSCSSDRAVADLVAAGVDVFRLNFSHGTHESHGEAIARVRRAAAAAGRSVALLQDLSGPKIRTGALAGGTGVRLETGAPLTIEVGTFAGDAARVATGYRDLPAHVRAGQLLLLDDGRIQLQVARVAGDRIETVVVDGGVLGEHKGINLPGVELPPIGLTEKDRADLRFGVQAGIDFMALSFVQSPAVIDEARAAIRSAGGPDIPVVAKLERPEAVRNLDGIIAAADAVMVARGDLGLELPFQQVPRVQKEVAQAARAAEVPVILATQVLESMRTEPRPTRAEVSDAAHAVDEGVDAIMLAGETASGAHPVRAVQTLDLVIRDAETLPPRPSDVFPARTTTPHALAICQAAVTLAAKGGAQSIVAVTRGGKTARILSALRPAMPILAATDREDIARRTALWWGVTPALVDLGGTPPAPSVRIGNELAARGVLAAGSLVVIVSVTPDLSVGPSNYLRLLRV